MQKANLIIGGLIIGDYQNINNGTGSEMSWFLF